MDYLAGNVQLVIAIFDLNYVAYMIYIILYRRYGHQHRLNQARCNHDH